MTPAEMKLMTFEEYRDWLAAVVAAAADAGIAMRVDQWGRMYPTGTTPPKRNRLASTGTIGVCDVLRVTHAGTTRDMALTEPTLEPVPTHMPMRVFRALFPEANEQLRWVVEQTQLACSDDLVAASSARAALEDAASTDEQRELIRENLPPEAWKVTSSAWVLRRDENAPPPPEEPAGGKKNE